MQARLSRRTVLKGLGAAIALPWLEAMAPALSWAAPTAAKSPPKRMVFLYVPNGIHMQDWTPLAEGANFTLPYLLEPLAPFKDDLFVLSGLTLDKARANGDGPGDHARAMASFLTGVQAKKTAGADIRAGISVDQVAALKVGKETKFPSLELGIEPGRQAGNCDSGYSCAYSSNLSWRSESTPMAKEVNPRLLFERLFTSGPVDEVAANRAKRDFYKKSILDFVAEDASRLQNQLGANDQRKLDEYLNAIRELEIRIARAEAEPPADGSAPPLRRPAGIPRGLEEHIRIMADLLVLAFQADLTRISTFVFANEGSNRSYRFLDVPEGHHDLSHHGGNKEKHEKIKKINRFHLTQLAYFLGKLKAVKEGDGTLLDNCMIVYGSGIGDGNRHNHHDLPILLIGKGGGQLKPGRHIRYKRETPLTNLYLSMLDVMGVPTEKLGDSTGKLNYLSL
jgi:hypothetical protein